MIRREALAVAALVAVAYLLLRTAPALVAGAFSDDGVYLSLGRALAEGQGFRSVYSVGVPVHLKYPPGLPLLYAVLWWWPGGLTGVQAAAGFLSLVAAATTAGLLWWIARSRLGLTRLIVATLAIGPFLLEGSVQYLNLPISEPFFMMGWACCLLLFPKAVDGRIGWALVLGLLVGAGTLVRTQAVVLIPALVLAAWVRGRSWRRPMVVALAALVPVVGWGVVHAYMVSAGPLSTQPDEAAYAAWAPESLGGAVTLVVQILGSQARRYWTALPPHLASSSWVGGLLWALLAFGCLWGSLKKLKAAPELVLSVVSLSGVILLWPYSQDRFVLALLPFAGLLTAVAGQELLAAAKGRGPVLARSVAVAMGTAVLVVGLRQVQIRAMASNDGDADDFYFHPAQFLPDNSEFVIAASRWLIAESRPDDRLLTPLSSALWLYTGRQGVNATPAEPNVGPSVFDVPGRFLATRVLEDDVNLLLLWNPNFLISRDGATVQAACPDALRFEHMTEEPARVAIFRIHRDDPCFRTEFLEPARVALAGNRADAEAAQ